MSAIPYLFLTQLKNRLKTFVKKPGNLLIAAFIAALLVLMLFSGGQQGAASEFRDINELYAVATALLALMFMLTTFSGLKNGTSLFSLADTHTLFTAPISPRRILFYGLFRQLGTSLLVGIFLPFQYPWLSGVYGINVGFIFIFLIFYGMAVFAGQLTALVLYTFSSDDPIRRRNFRITLYAISGIAAVYLAYKAFTAQPDMLPAVVTAANGPILSLFPVGGWLGASVRLLMGEKSLLGLLPLLGFLVYIAIIVVLLMRTNTDFYEDVLDATQTAHDQRAAQKEGRGIDFTPKHVRTGKTGLGNVSGAAAISAKQRLESRRARTFIFEPITMIFMICTIVYAYFVRDMGLIPIVIFSVYLLIFEVGNARWTREFSKPYTYLIPAPPFKKLICLLSGEISAVALAAIIQYGVIGLILGQSVEVIICLILLGFCVSLLIMAGNVLYNRLLGISAKGVMMIINMLLMLALIIPPIVVFIVTIDLSIFGLAMPCIGLLLAALTALVEGAGMLFLCRNTLMTSEML